MTITNTTSRKSFAGNGTTTAFSFPYRVLDDDDLDVYLDDVLKTKTTHYSVSGVGDDSGVTITMVTAPASGETLVAVNNPDIVQEVDYTANDRFPAETHERALDRLTLIARRNRDLIARSVRWPDDYAGAASLEIPTPTAGAYWRWANDGLSIEYVAASPDDDSFTGSGTGAVERTWSAKVGERISAKDFGAVADGATADTAAVQAALDSGYAIDFGGPENVYLIDTITLADGESYRLYGQGATLKLIDDADAPILYNSDTTFVSELHISGLKFNGNKANQNTYGAHAIDVFVDKADIHDNEFFGVAGDCVRLDHVASYARIHDNTFYEGKAHSGVLNENSGFISLRSSSTRAVSTKQNISVEGNTLIGVDGDHVFGLIAQGFSAASADQTHRLLIRGNTFWECGQDLGGNKVGAMTLYRRAGRSIVTDNYVYGGAELGIDIQGSDNVIVSGNLIDGVAGSGIGVAPRDGDKISSNVVVQGNILTNIGATGIWCNSTTGIELRNISIIGNQVKNALQAIKLNFVDGGIVVSDNLCEDITNAAPSTGDRCIVVRECDATITIHGNVVIDSENQGIRVEDSTGIIVINDNLINDAAEARAIDVRTITGDVTIEGNILTAVTAAEAINIFEITGRARVHGNTLPASSTIRAITVTDAIVRDNAGVGGTTAAGAGAIDVWSAVTYLETDSNPDAMTLADGAEGMRKALVMTVDLGDAVVTPANLLGGTTITFDAVGDSADLLFTDGEWVMMGGTAALA